MRYTATAMTPIPRPRRSHHSSTRQVGEHVGHGGRRPRPRDGRCHPSSAPAARSTGRTENPYVDTCTAAKRTLVDGDGERRSGRREQAVAEPPEPDLFGDRGEGVRGDRRERRPASARGPRSRRARPRTRARRPRCAIAEMTRRTCVHAPRRRGSGAARPTTNSRPKNIASAVAGCRVVDSSAGRAASTPHPSAAITAPAPAAETARAGCATAVRRHRTRNVTAATTRFAKGR